MAISAAQEGIVDDVPDDSRAPGWGAFLGERMAACGLPTNRDLARAAGVPESVISRWRTRGVRPSVEQLRRLVGPLRLTVLELLVAAGYLSADEAALPPSPAAPPGPVSVLEALAADPVLPPALRQVLADHYRALAEWAVRGGEQR